MRKRLPVKYPLFLSDFDQNSSIPDTVLRNATISNFIQIRPVEADLFHADERTERRADGRDKPNSRFSQFCERD
jgi:hypothetical protein